MVATKKGYDYVKDSTIKDFTKKVAKIKISQDSLDILNSETNLKIETIVRKGKKLAQAENFKTIMLQHMIGALEQEYGQKDLPVEEFFNKILKLPASDIGQLVKLIQSHLDGKKG